MGRLQRKKQVGKKKKTKKNTAEFAAAVPDKKTAVKNVVSLTRFSKNKKTQVVDSKKFASLGRSGEIGQGYIQKGLQFFREVKIELKKVTWPSRNQTIGSTVVVILLVMIISVFLGLVDFSLSNLVRLVLR
jgi:preprotein translocase subunit SecE